MKYINDHVWVNMSIIEDIIDLKKPYNHDIRERLIQKSGMTIPDTPKENTRQLICEYLTWMQRRYEMDIDGHEDGNRFVSKFTAMVNHTHDSVFVWQHGGRCGFCFKVEYSNGILGTLSGGLSNFDLRGENISNFYCPEISELPFTPEMTMMDIFEFIISQIQDYLRRPEIFNKLCRIYEVPTRYLMTESSNARAFQAIERMINILNLMSVSKLDVT